MAGSPLISSDAPRRFVVLRHADADGTHFDLMIEWGDRLATWKGTARPETCITAPWACRRIANHRRDYLVYEGAVSGNRGEVTRHDEGSCVLQMLSEQRIRLHAQGRLLRGDFELSLTSPEVQGWSMSPDSSSRPR